MSTQNLKFAITAIIFLCLFTGAVSGITITAQGGTIPSTGNTAQFPVIVDSLPLGLSGYNLTVSLSDPAKGEIVGVTYPSWAGDGMVFAGNGPLPADSVWVYVVDLWNNVKPGATNVELTRFEIRGDANGSTGLLLPMIDIQDDEGNPVPYSIINGTIIIGSTPPPVNTGILYVQSNPTTAEVRLDGLYQGTSPLTIPNVSAGDHTLRLEKTGYSPWQDQVTVTAGITNPVYVTLTPIPPPPTTGTLVVNSNPDGADVKLNGTYRGLTNLTIPNVSAAIHTVRVEKMGYYPWENTVSVAAGGTTIVNVGLTAIPPIPTTGTVNVTSDPSGAQVRLDNVAKGTTPLEITDVSVGVHTIRVEMTGYEPFISPIEVNAGQTTYVTADLDPIPPPPVTKGNLSVISTPSGASVILNGTPKGPTPLLINDVTAGGYTLRVESAGYTPREEDIIVTAGLTTYINWTLIPIPITNGTVSVQSTPSGASVTLNGTPKGPTPLLINDVTAGGYTLRVESAGYTPREVDIIVTAGLTTYVNWTLLPIPPTTGNVSVKSTPSNASVFLNGTPKGETPLVIEDLTAGDYSLYVEAAGYYPREEDIMVTAGLTTIVNWTLVPIPTTGNLDITSVPSGANVFLDDDLQGPTPLSIVNLEPGQYTVRIEKSNYQTWNGTFNVTTGNTTVVNAVLTPITTPTPTPTPTPSPIPTTVQEGRGGLLVLSEPIATVFIDGKERGISGQVIDQVQAGTRAVTLFKPGYKLVSFPVKINPARATVTPKIILEPDSGPPIPPTTVPTTIPTTVPTTLPTIIPTTFPTIIPTYPGPLTGSLFVYSVPWGCSVYIDDTYRGVTPGLYSQLVPGSHVLKVSRTGYVDAVRSFNVNAGDVTTLTIIMVPDISGLVAAFL